MKQALLPLLLLCVFGIHLQAQPVLTPRNMALGGGGSTYLTDYQTNFYNPANLMIQDQQGDFSIGVGVGGFLLEAVNNYSDPEQQYKNARDYISPHVDGSTVFNNALQDDFFENNFPNNRLLSENNRTRYETTLLGMKWKRENKAFSIALRTRTASNYETGKGWYSDEFEAVNGQSPALNRTLNHRYQSLHEISFGYAESFQFLTNLTSRLDNFIIGIAPKVVLGGDYLNAEWSNIYEQQNGSIRRTQAFSYDASGQFGTSSSSYATGADANIANGQFSSDSFFDINGIGAGLDIGITYLLTLGSDLSAIRPDQQPTQKSLRLSFSMTDIGFVSYSNDEFSISANPDTLMNASAPASLSNEYFIGAKGQYINFIQKFGESNPFLGTSPERESFSTLLPIALHGGALLEINRLKLMGDVSIGLTNSAFNSPRILSSAGIEIRPLQFLPLRGGIQFRAQRPEFISLGMAIETRYWDFSVAAQLTPESLTSEPVLTGISVATLQFHF